MGEEEREDEKRETAIASTPLLQHAFKPRALTQNQISKFQELHKRRLQIKSKSKVKKKQKGFFSNKGLSSKDFEDKDSNYLNTESDNNEKSSSQQQESVAAYVGTKQRQKLHWGYDMLTYYLVIVNSHVNKHRYSFCNMYAWKLNIIRLLQIICRTQTHMQV
ncbi:hypothetical protein FNV43_RR13871 [Rhamnella rubrinervis]|uniref:Uncharacterized protein n=1 Tax=Rhamnella rubrinervis TaxID=2594499 RepID=A0A8K0H1T6_9ROSA|nr:hypothetical protein FNV43_RR13871 [Rhamnella rubrinervis]